MSAVRKVGYEPRERETFDATRGFQALYYRI